MKLALVFLTCVGISKGSSENAFTNKRCVVGEYHCQNADCVPKGSEGNYCKCRDDYYVYEDGCLKVPTIVLERPAWGNGQIESGSRVSLRCDVGKYVAIRTLWRQDGYNDPYSAGARENGQLLEIPSFSDRNTGYYECWALGSGFPERSPVSARFPLYLMGAPKPPIVTADIQDFKFGSTVNLLCTHGNGQSHVGAVKWYKNGLPVQLGNQNSLQFDPLTFRDPGSYTCQVKNLQGMSSLRSDVFRMGDGIPMKPRVTSDIGVYVSPGATVTLECVLDSFAFGVIGNKYEWFKKSHTTRLELPLPQTEMKNKLENFLVEDSGDYTCRVWYNSQSEKSDPLALRLKDNEPVIEGGREVGLLLGETFLFKCWMCSSIHRSSDEFPLTLSRCKSGKCSVNQAMYIIAHRLKVKAEDHDDTLVCKALIGGKKSEYRINVVSHPSSTEIIGPTRRKINSTGTWRCVVNGANQVAPSVLWLSADMNATLPPGAFQKLYVEDYLYPNTTMHVIRSTAELLLTATPNQTEMTLPCFASHELEGYGLWSVRKEVRVDLYCESRFVESKVDLYCDFKGYGLISLQGITM
ncbi:hypothetical protein BaRGS_00025892 [Batillaria attramentaria]|uniref:Ig-like domain-containing protein n=1 Tax=Batillaria attramentaria TaxID=370345 RepID=A0ABD0K6C2_9CAEN